MIDELHPWILRHLRNQAWRPISLASQRWMPDWLQILPTQLVVEEIRLMRPKKGFHIIWITNTALMLVHLAFGQFIYNACIYIYIYLYIKRNHIRNFTSNTIIQIKLIYIRDLYVLWACGYQSIAPVRSKRRWKSSWIPWSKSQERLDNSYGRSAKAIPRANKCKSPALILWCILWCAMFIHGWCFDVICNIYIYIYMHQQTMFACIHGHGSAPHEAEKGFGGSGPETGCPVWYLQWSDGQRRSQWVPERVTSLMVSDAFWYVLPLHGWSFVWLSFI